MNKPFSSKKAQSDLMVDVGSFFLYLLFLIIFMLIFSMTFGGCEKEYVPINERIIGESESELGEEMLILNYLRTNATADGKTFGELMAESCLRGEFETLEQESSLFFEQQINKRLGYASVDGKSYKRPKIALYLKCDPDKRAKTLIYHTEKDPLCAMDLVCDISDDRIITIPLPFRLGEGSYAQLILKGCVYVSTSQSPVSVAQIDSCV